MIGRIVCAGDVPRNRAGVARKALRRAIPSLNSTRAIVTPGGFLHFTIEAQYAGSRGWHTDRFNFDSLGREAEQFYWDRILTNNTFGKLLNNGVKYLTVGIDPYDLLGKLGEFVIVHDIQNDCVHVTGKSFPRTDEEDELVLAPLDSHFITVDDERLMVLGCHDLNIWSGRSAANTTGRNRSRVRDEMRRRAARFQPTTVIHHAHATDSEKTWAGGWSGLLKALPSVRSYTTALGFYNGYTRNKVAGFRSSLETVQNAYHSEDVKDTVLVF